MKKKLFLFLGVLIVSCQNTTKKTTTVDHEENYRPSFHFTPKNNWMNDPNGMFFFNDTYHLYFQHYPEGNVWGPMHWGHATSKNLVDWEEQPIALYPDEMGYIFSGSAIVDSNNTSGFGKDGKTPIVAIFTHHNMDKERAKQIDVETQSIAYSLDEGMTWTKYEGNPVIENPKIRDFRDPKVTWHQDTEQWILTLAAHDNVRFYSSPNLKEWTYLSDFGQDIGHHGGVWECPDLFPLKEKNSGETKWVLLVSVNPGGPNQGSATQYFIGYFDGENFTLDPEFANELEHQNNFWVDFGRDNYAGVTWQNTKKANGNKLFMGWMSNWDYAQVVPTQKWRSSMTIAREVGLINTENGYRLTSTPVENAFALLQKSSDQNQDLNGWKKLELNPNFNEKVGYRLSNHLGEVLEFGFDANTNQFYVDRTAAGRKDFSEKFAHRVSFAPRISNDKTIKGIMLLDKTSIELFWDNGTTIFTEIFFPNAPFTQMEKF
ncbi:MAG: glycoside hydrolase family 32 protein [Flavobacteriaceae bacterium]|nr:glycoside hydrolase family 32 protein [Flavobacteriaceae bacterium]